MEAEQQKTLRQYLLGEVSSAKLAEIEERLLADGAFYEELLLEEDELVDQYLRGNLSAPENEHFEAHFLSTPERRQKLNFAAALNRYITAASAGETEDEPAKLGLPTRAGEVPEPPPKWRLFSLLHVQSPIVGFAFAATVLVILFGASWLIIKNRSQSEPHDILTAVIAPVQTTRSNDNDEVRTFILPPSKDTVRLHLQVVANDYPVYRAVLQDGAGSVLLQKDIPAQIVGGRPVVILDVPAPKLLSGTYQIRLTGVTAGGKEEKVGSYRFKIS